MSKQLIFCLETNKKANTDWIYIQELLRKLYLPNPDVKITPVYMGAKQKYNSNTVKREIRDYKSMYPGDSFVLMCIDVDRIFADATQKTEFDTIKQYCIDNDYKFVWFNMDIEDVFQGHRVDKNVKVKEAAKYQRLHAIEKLDLKLLKKTRETEHGSNICLVCAECFEEDK